MDSSPKCTLTDIVAVLARRMVHVHDNSVPTTLGSQSHPLYGRTNPTAIDVQTKMHAMPTTFRVSSKSIYGTGLHSTWSQDDPATYELKTYPGVLLENDKVRVNCNSLGGRVLQMFDKRHRTSCLYKCHSVFYRGVEQGVFALKKGIAVYGGNFLTFPTPEHGRYFDRPVPMTHHRVSGGAQVVFSRTDDEVRNCSDLDAFTDYATTGGTFRVSHTLPDGSDILHTELSAYYPRDVEKTAVWYATTITCGDPPGEIPTFTEDAFMILSPGVTETYEHDDGSWFKDKPQNMKISEIQHVAQWKDMGSAYVRSKWMGLYDRNEIHVFVCEQELNWKLWSFGKPSLNTAENSIYQPYFEPSCSPVNTTCAAGTPGVSFRAKKGMEVKWSLREFTIHNVPKATSYEDMQAMIQLRLSHAG